MGHRAGPHPVERVSHRVEARAFRRKHDRHRQHLDRKAGAGQVGLIEADDPAPRGLEVDLGHHLDHHWARRAGSPEEVELGHAQLLRGVRHEEHRVGGGERGNGGRVVHGREAPDTRSVDELDAPGEQR